MTASARAGRHRIAPRALVLAAMLLLAGAILAWLATRAALVRTLAPTSPTVLRVAPHDPGAVLGRAAEALVRQHGILSPATLAAVRAAAAAAPLDARAFLVLGHQQLLDGEGARALRTLEAGRRLDPRQRLIHLLLLDRYLRTGRYGDAAREFSVLARLMGPAQGPIATAMAQMALAPETRGPVRRIIAADPMLERGVLTALARTTTPPSAIFALATPAAIADAGGAESWGPALIARLVENGRFADARAAWRRIYRLSEAAAAAPIFDAALAGSGASAPFNWTFTASGLGAADRRAGALTVDYYGRDSGTLASQLLTLAPGGYRFAVTIDPGGTGAAAGLAWTVTCYGSGGAKVLTLPVRGAPARRRVSGPFVVPPNCPAQVLALEGQAGEFPVAVNLTMRAPSISEARAGS